MGEPSRDPFAPALRRVPARHRVPKGGRARRPPGLFLSSCRPLKCPIHSHTPTLKNSHSHTDTHSRNDPHAPRHNREHAFKLSVTRTHTHVCLNRSDTCSQTQTHILTPIQIHAHTREPNPFPSGKDKTKIDFSFFFPLEKLAATRKKRTG